MLLANMAVAHKIKCSFPDHAILRRHPPPQQKPLDDMVNILYWFYVAIYTILGTNFNFPEDIKIHLMNYGNVSE